ncbi:exosortase/archaeosortase family protein [Limnoglobus roseus]|uniref:Exosortase n=1 Tax=Limnoglobus roseus TaxID=2598579 RepID=A0A5C1AFE5_9BACT|nr:exosortase/archaeosortase family protein [Limnoglobus roseus]QEL18139.1 exosortase [Limnoglobus roseus]
MSNTTTKPLFLFGTVAALLAWAYWPTLAFLYEKWIGDPQYSHGFLVPLFSAYLINQNRDRFRLQDFNPWPILGGGVLVLAGLMRVLAGGLLFHQLDAISLLLALAGAALAFGGKRLLLLTAPAILFLAFAIPLPFEVERNVGGPLKKSATIATTYLLQAIGFPAIAEGNLILIDEVRLGVVDACSGLKMLMTFAAFSIGAVLLNQRSWFERGMVILGIVPVAMLTNILRIAATGVSHTFVHDKATNALLHDVYGWFMMPVGLGLLALELWILKRLVVAEPRRGVDQ